MTKKKPSAKAGQHKDHRKQAGRPAATPVAAIKPGKPGYHKPGQKTKGQSALATAVAEDELEERRRLFAKARKGDNGAVAKIYELYGARIYTTAQVKEVKPARFNQPTTPLRKRAQRA